MSRLGGTIRNLLLPITLINRQTSERDFQPRQEHLLLVLVCDFCRPAEPIWAENGKKMRLRDKNPTIEHLSLPLQVRFVGNQSSLSLRDVKPQLLLVLEAKLHVLEEISNS